MARWPGPRRSGSGNSVAASLRDAGETQARVSERRGYGTVRIGMTPFVAELVGTAILILLGNGVVANVVLERTKGHGSGWIVITFGWGMAVFVAVFCAEKFSGAHLNPAVTLAMAVAQPDTFAWTNVPL